MKLPKILVGLILWGMMVYSPNLHAQNLDFSTHRGNPLVYMGQSKITFDFRLNGVPKTIDILKSCAYYKRVKRGGGEELYGVWLNPKPFIDYVSNEGWGLRIHLDRGFSCSLPEQPIRLIDWNFNPSSYEKVVLTDLLNDFRSRNITPIRARSVKIYYIDNVDHPSYRELQIDNTKDDYKVFNNVSKFNVMEAQTLSFEYLSIEQDKGIYTGTIKKLDALEGKFRRQNDFITFSGFALAKDDWQKNEQLKGILNTIAEPTIIDHKSNPIFKPLYEVSARGNVFPDKETSWGLNEDYNLARVFMKLTPEGYWDVRQISFSQIQNKIEISEQSDPKERRKIFDVDYVKILAGNILIDLKDHKPFQTISAGRRSPHIWLYDPVTGILFRFTNNFFKE